MPRHNKQVNRQHVWRAFEHATADLRGKSARLQRCDQCGFPAKLVDGSRCELCHAHAQRVEALGALATALLENDNKADWYETYEDNQDDDR